MREQPGERHSLESLVYTAGALALAAGVIHGVATAEYWNGWWGYAAFFTYAAISQIVYGLVLFIQPWRYDETGGLRASSHAVARRVFVGGVIGNGLIIILYVITRTVGIPFFGPAAGHVLPVTPLSAVSKLTEAALIIYLVSLIKCCDRMEQSRLRAVAKVSEEPVLLSETQDGTRAGVSPLPHYARRKS